MAAFDLTDVDTVKRFARVKAGDGSAQARLELLISAMSKAIGRHTRRQWLGKTHGVDLNASTPKTFEYDGSGYLSLEPFEAREIVSVTMDGKTLTLRDPGEAVTGTNYLPTPSQKTTEDTYLSLRLPKIDCYLEDSLVVVTAKWGIDEVDGDVELACVHAVADAYRNPEGAASRSFEGIEVGEDTDQGGSLPRASRALLIPFLRG